MGSYDKDETRDDAKVLVSLRAKFGVVFILDTLFFIFETLLPLAKMSTNVTFIEGLAKDITDGVKAGNAALELAKEVCDEMFGALVAVMRKCCPYLNHEGPKFEHLRQGNLSEKISSKVGYIHIDNSRFLSAGRLVYTVEACEILKLHDLSRNSWNFSWTSEVHSLKPAFGI